ncbi:MAG: metallophosphoesterase, partial [Culicoidibacterales bacterium]
VPLVLVGHAHGGQVRLPFTEGVFAPGQGLWPQLTSGVHTQAETTMVISRGLGNSAFPIRVQNRPEIVTVTLSSE